MNPDLTIPNIRKMETSREDLFAFDITGHVTAGDVENVYGLLEEAYARHEKIDLLVRMVDCEGWDWDAVTQQNTAGGKRRALTHIRRYAVVGGPAWVSAMMTVLDPFFSIEMRHFAADEEADAFLWLEEPVEA